VVAARIPIFGLTESIRLRLEAMESAIIAAVAKSGNEGSAHWERRLIG